MRQAPLMRAHVAPDAAGGRWLLLLLRHHLISDHATLEVLQSEIEAHLAGRANALPAPLPFRDFVAQARNGVSQDEHRAFFTEMLGDVEDPTAPFGVLDVRGDGSAMREARLEVDGRLAARLRERARALGVSAASVFHVAWAQVLARASGQEDVVFGTLLLGRMHGGEGASRVMGPFINTLPIRVHAGAVAAEACVRRTHALLAGLMRHEHASLALAQRCSAVEAPSPLFTTLLNFRHSSRKTGSHAASAPVAGGMIYAEERTNYPLALSVDDLGEGFRLKGQVMHASLDPDRVCAFVHRALEGLVEALETAPSRAIGRIEVLPESERGTVLGEWTRMEADYPAASCIHHLVEARAAEAPDTLAVVCEGESLTYAELNAVANRLAHHLRALGVRPDVRVAICVERSPEMLVGLLGILKAGGAYVPLDPAYPAERLAYMLADSAPAAVLTQAALRDRVAGAGVPVLVLDAAAPAWAEESAANPAPGALTPAHLAYVVYTSGSTGRPKGVMVSHESLANLVHWHRAAFGVGPGTRSSSVASLGFDAATWEIWPPLAGGGELALPGRGRVDPEAILDWWDEQALDVSFLPTPMAEYAFSRGVREGTVRTLLVGGDRLRRVPAEPMPFRLVNNYGPTETTVVATSGDVRGSAIPGIGRPVGNARTY
ncbi:MAG TPA: AMP-binding protein, partial [Longimicrobium sp.]|nr:AMP-binding protein [Longimicrobium sp.]